MSALRVGILADTHGLLRPQALERLAGCDLLLHAGDVGEAEILSRLGALAPVVAVRGNTDCGDLARLPAVAAGTLEAAAGAGKSAGSRRGLTALSTGGEGGEETGTPFRMTHRREDVPPGWTREARLVVFGHSHRPELEWQGACLLLNPGSCGPSRFSLPLTVAVVTVDGRRLIPEILAIG